MIVAIIGGALVLSVVIMSVIRSRDKFDPSTIPSSPHKTGIYKGDVTIQVTKKGYNFLTEPRSVPFTAIVKEKKRYGDKIEVKYVKLINTPNYLTNKILDALNDKHELIPLKDVKWEYDIPDVLIDRASLRELLNGGEVTIGEIHVKLDSDIERKEMLDIVIEETHG